MAELTIVNPVALPAPDTPGFARFAPAKRLDSLDGRTIGLYWNGKPQGNVALIATAEVLKRTYPEARFVDFFADKGAITRFASDGLREAIAERCDAVVSATAD